MKNIKILTLILAILIVSGCSSKNEIQPEDNRQNQDIEYIELLSDEDFYFNQKVVFSAKSGDKLEVAKTNNCKFNGGICYEVMREDGQLGYIREDKAKENHKLHYNTTPSVDQNSSILADDSNNTNNIQTQKVDNKTYTQFEKMFTNHIAYNHYKKAMKLMYEKKHKEAYEEAIKAKDVYNNSLKENQVIELPFIPGYIRESAQTPKRTYYKIIEEHIYELKRLIRKIKLLNPPIPFVVLNQTSTYIDITVENFGDTPLDNLIVEINYEKVATFPKIYPLKSETIRYHKTMNLEQITFTEDYGFAPSTIEFSQEAGE
ncbi:MAG: hypothetical protein KAJ49_05510 [Arcobacteraceae bacterium]|nr:hypothetical protein [Arcobacteraceae bacterium]